MTREEFNEKLNELINAKRCDNSAYFTREKYNVMLREVRAAKIKCKKPLDYRRTKRFDIVQVNGQDKLIAPLQPNQTNIRYYASTDELYDILVEAHSKIGHAGRHKMLHQVQKKYKNVTSETIMLFLNLCDQCKGRKGPRKAPTVVESTIDSQHSRCQVDVIDLPPHYNKEYKFLLIYQDYYTKFLQLRPLKTKTTEEVAQQVLQIFYIFGVPVILHSKNGREFSTRLTTELNRMWKGIKIVHGKVPRNQVQSTSQDIQNMLTMWMADNNTDRWFEGVPFVQFTMNTMVQETTPQTPFEAMFHTPPKKGLLSYAISADEVAFVETEEQLALVRFDAEDNEESAKDRVDDDESTTFNWNDPLVNLCE